MNEDYMKYNVNINLMDETYKLFKNLEVTAISFVETYKKKRSVYMKITNLIPSVNLLANENREYHLIIIGANNGEIIHKDFGTFFVNQDGEGNLFKKFLGPPIESYTHLALIASNNQGKAITILSGQLPFAKKDTWSTFLLEASKSVPSEFFSSEIDETRAKWHKVSGERGPSAILTGCEENVKKYGHYIIGEKNNSYYIGIPGRFLMKEQPLRGEKAFLLWQPIRGGEKFFKDLSQLTGDMAEEIFGYWIGEIDVENEEIKSI